MPLSLMPYCSHVQLTLGANLGSTGAAYDKTGFVSVIDSARPKEFRIDLVYPTEGEPLAERSYNSSLPAQWGR